MRNSVLCLGIREDKQKIVYNYSLEAQFVKV